MSGVADGSNPQEVVIKDAWPPAESPVLEDPRSEIVLLRKIRSEFEANPPSPQHIYPKLVVGGHIKLARDEGTQEIDTTDAIFQSMGVERLNPPPGNGEMEALHWRCQPLRAHRRIVMSPVGHSVKTVRNEKELIVVLAEAMRCHSSILGRCGILHRDISTNNILVVRPGGHSTSADADASVFGRPSSSPLPRGLLIDFDFAIEVGISERTARPERSGTLPYMSIANLLNLGADRTALDDWESALAKSEILDDLVDPDSLVFDQQESGRNDDPIIKRNEYANDIIANLQSVMQEFEDFARENLNSA
ncbi:hypothetical protein GGI11_000418 [Coemansia sp. RSA 2049]|nr:hypothetical protein GGI11_000418 [Coemansia sp. RSA 2049]